jgi:hypothetical protein
MESVVSAAGRAQEQVWIAKQVFGDDITVTCLPGRWRSGFCKCDKEKCEYPGCVDIKVPGLKYWITGCMFCRRYGVARGDIESGRWAAVCERCGIVVK